MLLLLLIGRGKIITPIIIIVSHRTASSCPFGPQVSLSGMLLRSQQKLLLGGQAVKVCCTVQSRECSLGLSNVAHHIRRSSRGQASHHLVVCIVTTVILLLPTWAIRVMIVTVAVLMISFAMSRHGRCRGVRVQCAYLRTSRTPLLAHIKVGAPWFYTTRVSRGQTGLVESETSPTYQGRWLSTVMYTVWTGIVSCGRVMVGEAL